MSRKAWASMIGALLLSACGTLTHDHIVTGGLGHAFLGDVQIVMDTSPEPAVDSEIGIVRAIGTGNRANLDSVIEGLRVEAHEIGADAVIRVRIDQGHNSVSAVGVGVMLRH